MANYSAIPTRSARSRPGYLRFVCLSVAFCAALTGCQRGVSDSDIRPISKPEVVRLVSDERRSAEVLLLDARSRSAYETERIPGARHITLDRVSGERGDIDPALAAYRMLIVYGENPGSATARGVAKRLMSSGHKNVWLYFGGMSEWRRTERVERSVDASSSGD